MDWQDEIISLYLWVCDEYKRGLWACGAQRVSSYSDLRFSDEEVTTIYMYGVMEGLKDKKCVL